MEKRKGLSFPNQGNFFDEIDELIPEDVSFNSI